MVRTQERSGIGGLPEGKDTPPVGKRIAALVLGLVMLAGCSAKSLVISGELLDATGNQFVTTVELYNSLLDTGTISVAEYRIFAAFAKEFKVIYPPLTKVWEGVKNAPDSERKNEILNQALKLKDKLLVHYLYALGKLEVR